MRASIHRLGVEFPAEDNLWVSPTDIFIAVGIQHRKWQEIGGHLATVHQAMRRKTQCAQSAKRGAGQKQQHLPEKTIVHSNELQAK